MIELLIVGLFFICGFLICIFVWFLMPVLEHYHKRWCAYWEGKLQ